MTGVDDHVLAESWAQIRHMERHLETGSSRLGYDDKGLGYAALAAELIARGWSHSAAPLVRHPRPPPPAPPAPHPLTAELIDLGFRMSRAESVSGRADVILAGYRRAVVVANDHGTSLATLRVENRLQRARKYDLHPARKAVVLALLEIDGLRRTDIARIINRSRVHLRNIVNDSWRTTDNPKEIVG